jgi:hypothetical protein
VKVALAGRSLSLCSILLQTQTSSRLLKRAGWEPDFDHFIRIATGCAQNLSTSGIRTNVSISSPSGGYPISFANVYPRHIAQHSNAGGMVGPVMETSQFGPSDEQRRRIRHFTQWPESRQAAAQISGYEQRGERRCTNRPAGVYLRKEGIISWQSIFQP